MQMWTFRQHEEGIIKRMRVIAYSNSNKNVILAEVVV